MTRINGGDNYNSIYNASNNATQDQNVAGLGENKLSDVNGNCLAWPKDNRDRDRDGDGGDHRTHHHHHHHHQRGPIGDPQVAAEIKHLLQELEQLLQGAFGGNQFGGCNPFGGGQMYPMRPPIDADKISFGGNINKAPIDADKISFR